MLNENKTEVHTTTCILSELQDNLLSMQIAWKGLRLLIFCTKNTINSIRLLSYYYQVRWAKLRKWWLYLREENKFRARNTFWEVRKSNYKHKSMTQHCLCTLVPGEICIGRNMHGSGREYGALYTHPKVYTLDYPCGFLF